MKLLKFFVAFLPLLTIPNAGATCPAGFLEHAEKCYKVSTDKLSWHEARFECLELEGNYDLAIIDNLELFEVLKPYNNHWIGLYSRVGETDFRWVDNTKVDFGKVQKEKPWAPTEPNDIGRGEDCVHTTAGGLWRDYDCGSELFNYICGPASHEWCEFISPYECTDEFVQIHCPKMCSVKEVFYRAVGASDNPQYDTDCNIIPSNAIYIKLVMGSVVDYFKPVEGKTYCQMLQSNNLHQWSTNGKDWTIPSYHSGYLGGSAANYPNDGRTYLSFWGSGHSGSYGGCCHNSYSDGAAWNRAFNIFYGIE